MSNSFKRIIRIIAVVFVAWLAFLEFMLHLGHRDHDKKRDVAMSNVAGFSMALGQFQVDCGRYPTTVEGLTALIERPPAIPPAKWQGPYVSFAKIPADPWGRAYIYKHPGPHNTNGFDVSSGGPNGRPGSREEIGNWRDPGEHDYEISIVRPDFIKLTIALRAFQGDCGRYPTTEEGLAALIERPAAIPAAQWRGPYVVNSWKKIPADPWHRWYIYKCPGLHNTNGFDISSSGGNDHPGLGEEIGNW